MTNRHALVVDDSKAARVVLTRTLESFGMLVDAVESAELALDYLQHSKPDVIFMDYLLTGMDGLAAVRIIKANPHTAAIPVFMYSSQQDPAFAQAARVAGALGVLSKTYKNADVTNLLLRMRSATSQVVQSSAPLPAVTIANLRVIQAQRIAVIVLSIALVAGVGWLMYSNDRLQQQLAQVKHATNATNATSVSSASSRQSSLPVVAEHAPADAHVVMKDSETVPYGEAPLAGVRLNRLQDMFSNLQAKRFKGVLRVEVFTGDFCLQGDGTGGYHIAPAELPIKKCDFLGNPFADLLSVQQRQSADFTRFLSSVNPSGDISIQLADGGRQLATPYPAQSSTLTAGQWNLSAALNNRVEFSARTTE